MPEELLIRCCSPTLAGIKTGSLFPCPIKDKSSFCDGIRRLNARLVPRGVRLVPLRFRETQALVYLYRPDRLRRDLDDSLATQLLVRNGYPVGQPEQCVAELARRLTDGGFPHEVGLFLGYPPEDVHGFIINHAKHAKCTGVWKVYGDEQAAKRTFALYQKCTNVYSACYRKHRSLERLVVAAPQ